MFFFGHPDSQLPGFCPIDDQLRVYLIYCYFFDLDIVVVAMLDLKKLKCHVLDLESNLHALVDVLAFHTSLFEVHVELRVPLRKELCGCLLGLCGKGDLIGFQENRHSFVGGLGEKGNT